MAYFKINVIRNVFSYSLSDECLKLRVTENRSFPFLHFMAIYIYIYKYILYIYINIYIYIYVYIYKYISLCYIYIYIPILSYSDFTLTLCPTHGYRTKIRNVFQS